MAYARPNPNPNPNPNPMAYARPMSVSRKGGSSMGGVALSVHRLGVRGRARVRGRVRVRG